MVTQVVIRNLKSLLRATWTKYPAVDFKKVSVVSIETFFIFGI